VVDRIFDAVTRALERILALAFIGAVGLNFVNVVGRYIVGWTYLGADEIQIFIMVAMTFLGAVVVTWRNQHLRMDVLAQLCPKPVQIALRWIELALVVVLCGFVFVQSWTYTTQMFRLGRLSDTADVPMWIPHGAVAIGIGLIALITVWRGAQALVRHRAAPQPGPAGSAAGDEVRP
jgi:TRAP-type transport system small permease protein